MGGASPGGIRSRPALAAGLGLALLAAACADGAPPAPVGEAPAGKISFTSVTEVRPGEPLADGSPYVATRYVMNADGSGLAPVPGRLPPELANAGAVPSPDGSRAVFIAESVSGLPDLFVANADGSGRANLTNTPGEYLTPAWSPDSSRIAFVGPGGLSAVNADGSGLVNLTQHGAIGWKPDWSPDGAHISFFSSAFEGQQLYVMDPDGSGVVRIGTGDVTSPAWSPDASRIAFAEPLYAGDDPGVEVFVADVGGSGLTNLSDHPARDWFPTWSPDGSRIAFVSLRDDNAEIYVANADGSGLTNLSRHSGQDFCPAWSPDGAWIAFVSRRDGNREIYVMKADGSAQTRLTRGPHDNFAPQWEPSPPGRPTAQASSYGFALCSPEAP